MQCILQLDFTAGNIFSKWLGASALGLTFLAVIIQQMPSVFNLCLLEKYGLMTIYWKYYIRSYILRTSHVNKDNSAIGMQVLASGFFIQMYFFW